MSRRSAWRTIADMGRYHPLLPALMLVAILVATAAAALVLPDPINGAAALATAAGAISAAYLRWPKPALLSFALLMLFSRTLARWLQPELAQLDELLVPALVVLAALRTRPWRHRAWFNPYREGGLVLLMVAGVLSALLSGVPFSVWGLGLVLVAKIFAFFYVVLWHDFSAADIRQAVPVVLALALVVLAVGAVEALNPTAVREALNLGAIGEAREGLPSIKSLLWHPSTFSWFSAFVAIFLFAGYVVFRRWWLLVGGALFSAATVLGGRRRALIGLAVALGSGFVASIRRGGAERPLTRGWIMVGLATGAVALAFLPALIGLTRLAADDITDSGGARVVLYRTSVAIARDHFPLGAGFGRFGSSTSRNPYSPVYAEYGVDDIPGLSAADSSFVGDAYWAGILGEAGVAGLVGLLVFVGAVTLAAWRAVRTTHSDPLVTAFVLGAWMALVHTLVETLASSMFDAPPRIYLFFGTIAAALALQRAAARSDGTTKPPA